VLETSNLVCSFVWGMPSWRTNNSPESGRGLGHVTPIILAVRSAILATAWLLVLLFCLSVSLSAFSSLAIVAGII